MNALDRTRVVSLIALIPLTYAGLAAADETGVEAVPPYGPVTDQDAKMLEPPAGAGGPIDFVVAKEPPKITFSTVRGLPTLTDTKTRGGLWSLWGEGCAAANGKFYVGFGDHRGLGATCYLVEYDPATHANRIVVDVAKLIGQKPEDWGHGKIHGRLDEMPDGTIYFGTYWGEHPDRLKPEQRVHVGGRFLAYDTRTDKAQDLGMPYPGESFPMHATDTARGIFHAIGVWGGYFAYDVHAHKPLYCGKLPGDVDWDPRDTLVDEKTGRCYGSENRTRRIVGYDPIRNAFFHTRALVPQHPVPGKEKRRFIRSYTRRRLRDGSLICMTYDGVMFKFFPDEERTELIGTNWADGLYATSIATSLDDRYIYYTVGAHGSTWNAGSPIIQMDTATYEKKVLAFLHPYYQDKHGYVFGGSYSVLLDAKGANLLIAWNGRFRKAGPEGDTFGHLSFMYLEIPPTERGVTPKKK